MPDLRDLDLSRNYIGHPGAFVLRLENLRRFNLARNHMGFLEVAQLDEILVALPSLIDLDLSWNELGCKGAAVLERALTMPNLRRLNLEWNKLEFPKRNSLTRNLLTPPTLTYLNLRHNFSIGVTGAINLSPVLRNFANLRELRMHNTGIGSAGASTLATMIASGLPFLTYIELSNNRLSTITMLGIRAVLSQSRDCRNVSLETEPLDFD